MEQISDAGIRKRGFQALFNELGEVNTIRFISQISSEKRDYLKMQTELFDGMDVDEIYKKAKEYYEKNNNATL